MKNKEKKYDYSTSVSGKYYLFLIDDPGDRPLNLNIRLGEQFDFKFTGHEWAQLFYEVLGCPYADEYLPEDNLKIWLKRNSKKFRKAIPDLPMLSELDDIFTRVLFNLEQVKKLREEILKIIPKAEDNEIALQGLNKMKDACDKAIQEKKFLFFYG